MHKWVEKDDLMVFFVFKFGFDQSPLNRRQMAERIGTSEGSVNYRLGNFASIANGGKANHYAQLSKRVYNAYGQLSLEHLKILAFN